MNYIQTIIGFLSHLILSIQPPYGGVPDGIYYYRNKFFNGENYCSENLTGGPSLRELTDVTFNNFAEGVFNDIETSKKVEMFHKNLSTIRDNDKAQLQEIYTMMTFTVNDLPAEMKVDFTNPDIGYWSMVKKTGNIIHSYTMSVDSDLQYKVLIAKMKILDQLNQ